MVTRVGRAEPVAELLVSPLLSQRCVFYAVEVTDCETHHVLASERHGVGFLLVSSDGKRTAIRPGAAVVEGFGAYETTCRVGDASPRLRSFLEGKGLLGDPSRRVRVLERIIAARQVVHATGVLAVAVNAPPDPYRAAPRATEDALEPTGLVLVDVVKSRRVARMQWTAIGAVAALFAFFAFKQLEPEGYHGPDDCPPGTTFSEYYHSEPGDFCGNARMMRMWQVRDQHGEAAARGEGACVGADVTYWSPSEEPWTLRLTGHR